MSEPRTMRKLAKTPAKWAALTLLAAAVLWPVVEWQMDYSFKTLPQYLRQEWTWWIVAVR